MSGRTGHHGGWVLKAIIAQSSGETRIIDIHSTVALEARCVVQICSALCASGGESDFLTVETDWSL